MSKQSSTESGPSSSNRLSRQSSSATDGGPPPGGGNRNPYQSWHGTPRNEHPRRSGNNAGDFNSHTASLPRRAGQCGSIKFQKT